MDVSPSSLPRKELIYCGRDDAITADGRRAIVDVAAAQPSLICCNYFLSKFLKIDTLDVFAIIVTLLLAYGVHSEVESVLFE
jgi:hypothetical protein